MVDYLTGSEINELLDEDARAFSKSLMAMADFVENDIDKIIRKACIDFYRDIVLRTPVDTSRAKGSWSLTINKSEDHELPENKNGYSAGEIISIINDQVVEFSAEILGDEVVIYNNLKYIEFLEQGHSDQAPAGMVSVSMAAFTQYFNNAVSQLGGKIT